MLNVVNSNISDNSDKILTRKKLFNPFGDDSVESRRIVGGDTTNLLDLSRNKYSWAVDMYHLLVANFWIPEKLDISKDVNQYLTLSEKEAGVYDDVLSALIFLDSLQTNNLPNISDYITAPEVNLVLTIQAFQEAIHSQSYAYLVNTIIPKAKISTFFNKWSNNDALYKRNDFLVSAFQNFIDRPTASAFFEVLVADYILEGISFYMGFNIFYEFTYTKDILFGTSEIIRLINRDELTHVVIFKNLLSSFLQEINMDLPKDKIQQMFYTAVENEKAWINTILEGEGFLNISSVKAVKFIECLANERMKDLGCKPIFDSSENPFRYLQHISDLEECSGVKSNFFESNVTSYNMSSAVSDWDDIGK